MDFKLNQTYAARCPGCGEVVFVMNYHPAWRYDALRVIREGLRLEPVTDDFVRENFSSCKCPKQTSMFDNP